MGLFEKKYCDLCGDKVNALTRQKLSDGYLCSDCKHKLSSLSSGWKNRTLDDVKTHLEQREQNKQKYSAFVQSASAGTNEKLVVDFNNRKFYFTIGRDFKNSNPEIFDFSQLQDFWLELGYTTLQDSDRDGIPDEYDHYDNRQGRNSGFGSQFDTTNSFSGQNGMLDVPLALQPYVRDTNTSSSPQRISSLKAKFIVNHPFITDISMYVDSSIGTVRNELMRAFDDGMQLMRLCEQIRNGMQNNMGYQQNGMPMQNNMGYQQNGMPMQNNMGYQQSGMPMQNNMGYQQNGMPMQSNTVNQQVSQPFTPQNAAAIVCSACGYKPDGNPPKFCPFCHDITDMTLRSLFHNISKRKMRVKKEIVSVSYSKNHSNFDYCCSFYVRKKGVNFLFDAICKCGYIAFENVLIDETDMRLLCDTAEDALEILKKYNPKNKGLTVDDATVTIVEIIFSDKNSMSVSMTEQTLDSLEKAFFALAEKYCKDV